MKPEPFIMKGKREVKRGKMQWTFSDKCTATVPYTGPYAMLAKSRPKRGTILPEFPSLVVIGADITEDDGGTGTMTVHFELPNFTEEIAGNEPIADPEYEIAFNEEKAAIWVHPRCGFLHGDIVAQQNLHLDDWEGLLAYPDAYKVRVANPPEFTAPWTFADYIGLRERGVEDYLVAAPTVSRTLYYLRKPAEVGEGCFTHQDPPVGAEFDEVWKYDWLLGPDVVSKAGKVWRRTTRWIGSAYRVDDAGTLFNGWDDLVYD